MILDFLGLSYTNLEAPLPSDTNLSLLQPHLAPPSPPNHLYACLHQCLSINTSICHVTSPSMIPSVCQSTHSSVTLSVHDTASLSVIPDMSVCHTTSPSMVPSVCRSTCTSVALSVHDMACLSVIPIHHPHLSII